MQYLVFYNSKMLSIVLYDRSLLYGMQEWRVLRHNWETHIGPLNPIFSENLVETLNVFKSVGCELATILSRPQSINCINGWT